MKRKKTSLANFTLEDQSSEANSTHRIKLFHPEQINCTTLEEALQIQLTEYEIKER